MRSNTPYDYLPGCELCCNTLHLIADQTPLCFPELFGNLVYTICSDLVKIRTDDTGETAKCCGSGFFFLIRGITAILCGSDMPQDKMRICTDGKILRTYRSLYPFKRY